MMSKVKSAVHSDAMRATLDWVVLGTGILALGIAVIATSLSADDNNQASAALQTAQQVEKS